MRLAGARLDDGLLDFVVIETPEPGFVREVVESWLTTLSHYAERHLLHPPDGDGTPPATASPETGEIAGPSLPGVRRIRARSAIIETDQSLDVALDGELCARTPALVQVAPHALSVLLPEA